jgi:Fe-S cluster assembly protein SufD
MGQAGGSGCMSASAIKHYVDQFQHLQKELENDQLQAQRESAIELLQKTGFPTTRQENWKYTDIRPITGKLFNTTTVDPENISAETFDNLRLYELDCHELVFINGRYSAGHSSLKALPDGVVLKDLASALKDHPQLVAEHMAGFSAADQNGFTALNTAFIRDGAVIFLPPGAVIEKPIYLLYLSGLNDQPFASHPRNLIILSENSQATVIESYIGLDDSDYFTNTVTEVCMKQNTHLQHYKIQQESMQAYHIGNLKITQAKDSQVESHSISLGGALVRNDIHSLLAAEGAGIRMNGLYMATGKQHVDNHTRVDHLQPHTSSHEIYRGVLNDHARGVFNG